MNQHGTTQSPVQKQQASKCCRRSISRLVFLGAVVVTSLLSIQNLRLVRWEDYDLRVMRWEDYNPETMDAPVAVVMGHNVRDENEGSGLVRDENYEASPQAAVNSGSAVKAPMDESTKVQDDGPSSVSRQALQALNGFESTLLNNSAIKYMDLHLSDEVRQHSYENFTVTWEHITVPGKQANEKKTILAPLGKTSRFLYELYDSKVESVKGISMAGRKHFIPCRRDALTNVNGVLKPCGYLIHKDYRAFDDLYSSWTYSQYLVKKYPWIRQTLLEPPMYYRIESQAHSKEWDRKRHNKVRKGIVGQTLLLAQKVEYISPDDAILGGCRIIKVRGLNNEVVPFALKVLNGTNSDTVDAARSKFMSTLEKNLQGAFDVIKAEPNMQVDTHFFILKSGEVVHLDMDYYYPSQVSSSLLEDARGEFKNCRNQMTNPKAPLISKISNALDDVATVRKYPAMNKDDLYYPELAYPNLMNNSALPYMLEETSFEKMKLFYQDYAVTWQNVTITNRKGKVFNLNVPIAEASGFLSDLPDPKIENVPGSGMAGHKIFLPCRKNATVIVDGVPKQCGYIIQKEAQTFEEMYASWTYSQYLAKKYPRLRQTLLGPPIVYQMTNESLTNEWNKKRRGFLGKGRRGKTMLLAQKVELISLDDAILAGCRAIKQSHIREHSMDFGWKVLNGTTSTSVDAARSAFMSNFQAKLLDTLEILKEEPSLQVDTHFFVMKNGDIVQLDIDFHFPAQVSDAILKNTPYEFTMCTGMLSKPDAPLIRTFSEALSNVSAIIKGEA